VIATGAKVVDLGDRVLSATLRAEAVRHRLETRLEDRLQHQNKGSLHQPVHRGRNAQAPELAPLARFGDHPFPHRKRGERARLELLARVVQERHDIGVVGDEGRDHPVYPRCSSSLVGPHPFPGHREEVRVVDEVEQIIKPAARIVGRPLVQLGLHPSYPSLSLIWVWPRFTGIHQRLRPLQFHRVREPAGPLRHVVGFPDPGLLRVLRPSRGRKRTTRRPSPDQQVGQTGEGATDGSHVHHKPFVG
jgi:hypothetical protein